MFISAETKIELTKAANKKILEDRMQRWAEWISGPIDRSGGRNHCIGAALRLTQRQLTHTTEKPFVSQLSSPQKDGGRESSDRCIPKNSAQHSKDRIPIEPLRQPFLETSRRIVRAHEGAQLMLSQGESMRVGVPSRRTTRICRKYVPSTAPARYTSVEA